MFKAPECIRVLWINKEYFQITLLLVRSEDDYECYDFFYYTWLALLAATGYELDELTLPMPEQQEDFLTNVKGHSFDLLIALS